MCAVLCRVRCCVHIEVVEDDASEDTPEDTAKGEPDVHFHQCMVPRIPHINPAFGPTSQHRAEIVLLGRERLKQFQPQEMNR